MASIFSILGQAAAPRNSLTGTSIEDLERHLRGLLKSKVSPLKAELLSFTYEITSSARFTVSLSRAENDILEGLGGIDPELGGARSSEAPDGVQLTRIIAANDTIMNQPQDDPTLQRIVAKHIIESVGACDGSSWTLREVSRGPQGWVFTYVCKDSMQSWRRRNAKSMQNVVLGDYTEKERDPVSSSRPAFDCSGSMVISFSRSSRNISVKYKHMPFHKTVAELYDHFAPSPSPIPLVTGTQKTAKSSRKRDAPDGTGDGSSRKKSKQNNGVRADANGEGAAEAAPSNGSTVVDGQDAGDNGQPDGLTQAKLKRKRQYKRKGKEAAAGESGQQEGSAEPTQGGSGDAPAQLHAIVDVDPEEAERRRLKATELLKNAGVDPNTLSTDQFNIFANQSPALQQESLVMLVEYGAERLRIVHPNEGSSTQNAAQGESTVAGSSSPQASTAAGHQASAPAEGADAPASRQKRPRVSRGSCSNCRGRKGVKCGREKPACQNCIDAGVECVYPLQQSRPKKPKSEVADGADETSMMESQQDGDTTQMSVPEATMDSINLHTTNDELRRDLAMHHDQPLQLDGQGDSPGEAPVQQQDHSIPEQIPDQVYPPPGSHQLEPGIEPYQESEPAHRPPSGSKSRGGRRSLPAGRKSVGSTEHQPAAVTQSPEIPSWGAVDPSSLAGPQLQGTEPVTVPSAPVTSAQTQAQGYQDIQRVAALSHATVQTTQDPHAKAPSLQKQSRQSPYQTAAAASGPRTNSHQGHRGQSRTPVQDATALRPPGASVSNTHPPAQQHSVTPAQPAPATSAPHQHSRVANSPASRSLDAAAYNAASSLSGLGNYGFGFSSQNDSEQGSRIGYEPYSSHPVMSNQPYASDDNFNQQNSTNTRMPTTSAQVNTSGYATSSSMSNSRWPSQETSVPASSASAPTSQAHNPQAHFNRNMNQSTSNNPHAQSSSTPYSQKSQTQAPPYNPQQNKARAAQHQRAQQHHHQQNWYGLNSGGGGSGGDYRRGGAYVSGSCAQQGGVGIGGYDGDGDLIDLLAAVHPRP